MQSASGANGLARRVANAQPTSTRSIDAVRSYPVVSSVVAAEPVPVVGAVVPVASVVVAPVVAVSVVVASVWVTSVPSESVSGPPYAGWPVVQAETTRAAASAANGPVRSARDRDTPQWGQTGSAARTSSSHPAQENR
ncbi:hypothetical protein OV079_05810 [Nannocystis pusilla]|uniref:Uncharacterized protein n=1 Tax=Nannocystis pusilla TaxID=889268 RepID=A0A9X3EKX7_9BACT|nr:hypothetical protein [Nannocystis pusilla]MCY1005094.1 hypothetical protein [Nannocystis pusilla]